MNYQPYQEHNVEILFHTFNVPALVLICKIFGRTIDELKSCVRRPSAAICDSNLIAFYDLDFDSKM